MKKLFAGLVLIGLGAGVVGCGGTEPSARTKNGVVATTTTTIASSSDVELISTAGLIGYPLKLSARSKTSPDAEFSFSTTSSGCRVDTYLNFLYYEGSAQGTCTVAVTKLPALPVFSAGAASTTTTTLPTKVDLSTNVAFYQQTVPAGMRTGLVGYWPFNSSSTMGWNAVSNKVDLRVVGAPTFRPIGKFGGGVNFNGTGDYFAGNGTGDSLTGLPTNNGAYTMAMWMKPDKFEGGRGLMGWGTYGSDGDRKTNAFRLYSDKDPLYDATWGGLVNYWWGKDLTWTATSERETYLSGDNQTTCCRPAFTKSKWVHVAVTYDGTTRKIYYNGKQVASDVPGVANQVANKNFRIGATAIGKSEFFGGTLDDVAVWSRALDASEVVSLGQKSVGDVNSALPANFTPFQPLPCNEVGGFCEVGDTTADGATVFYVGDFTDQLTGQRMKYLAYAPDDLRSQPYGPGTGWVKGYERLCGDSVHPIPEADKAGIGWGRRNTVLISNFCTADAADKALALTIGASSDWFIPSERELNELCKYVRGQRTGDASVDCTKAGTLAPNWSMDAGHGYFLSSTQGEVVNATMAILGSIIGPLSDWLTIAVAIGQKTKALDALPWGDKQQWRVGYNFIAGTKNSQMEGMSMQIRPIRAFGPGAQLPLAIRATDGTVDTPLALTTVGGSGDGRVKYVVSDPGTAQCAASSDGLSVTPAKAGSCLVMAVKAGSERFFRAVAPGVLVNVAKGTQRPVTLAPGNGFVGVPIQLGAAGGTGTGAFTYSVKDAGTARCALVANSTNQITAQAVGTCTISVIKANDVNYLDSTAVDAVFTFAKQPQQALAVTPASGGIEVEVPLATTGGSGSGAVSYTITDAGPTACVLNAARTAVIGYERGDCKVAAAKAADNSYIAATSASVTISITNTVCTDNATRSDGSACQVGDTGPAGGRVFYISPTPIDAAQGISAGGTILEAAPQGWNGDFESTNFACRTTSAKATGSQIGDGAKNTLIQLTGACSEQAGLSSVVSAVIGAKDDWFVPSISELNELCKFMRRQATGDAAVACASTGSLRLPFTSKRSGNTPYWSSTEVDTPAGPSALILNVDTARQIDVNAYRSFLNVRPIRAFGPKKPTVVASVPPAVAVAQVTEPAQQCSALGARPDGSPCKVGDTGPAGGVVIVASTDVANAVSGVSTGGRYIEAAPQNWTNLSMKSSPIATNACGGLTGGAIKTEIGGGAFNTQKLSACGSFSNIATTVLGLSTTQGSSTFNDWFIPSRDEAQAMATVRDRLGGLNERSYVWTSSELDEPIATIGFQWALSMKDGSFVRASKGLAFPILRPVRAFG